MQQLLKISLIILLTTLIGTQLFAQGDTTQNLTNRQWNLVKNAHQKLLLLTINFCSTSQVKSKYPKSTKKMIDDSKTFLDFLNKTHIIDSSIALKIDSLNYSLLTSLVALFDRLQTDKVLFNQSNIRNQGKKLEDAIENLGRQIHEFNYWINEKNGINIKLKDINL
jgi:hypothetical protein